MKINQKRKIKFLIRKEKGERGKKIIVNVTHDRLALSRYKNLDFNREIDTARQVT